MIGTVGNELMIRWLGVEQCQKAFASPDLNEFHTVNSARTGKEVHNLVRILIKIVQEEGRSRGDCDNTSKEGVGEEGEHGPQ